MHFHHDTGLFLWPNHEKALMVEESSTHHYIGSMSACVSWLHSDIKNATRPNPCFTQASQYEAVGTTILWRIPNPTDLEARDMLFNPWFFLDIASIE
jgi:hypothetical protein